MVKNVNGLVFDHFYISPIRKTDERTVAHCKYTSSFRGGQFNMTGAIFELRPELFLLCSYVKALNAEVLVGIKDQMGVDIVPEARELQLYQNQCACVSGDWKAALSHHMRSCAITVLVGAVGLHSDTKKRSCSPDFKKGEQSGQPTVLLPSRLRNMHGFFEWKVFEEVKAMGDRNSPVAGGRGGFGPGKFVWGMVDHPYVNDVLQPGAYEPAEVGRLNVHLENLLAGLQGNWLRNLPPGGIRGLLHQEMANLAGDDYLGLI